MNEYDVIVLGSGPGGYVAAIRAAQLGNKVAIVEKENLGGVCLNWGCIPTKALLKSAQVFETTQHSSEYGIFIENAKIDFNKIIERSRKIAGDMQNGIKYLMKKNKIDVILGYGKILPGKTIEVTTNEGIIQHYKTKNIIIATGSRPKEIPSLPIDHKFIIDYKDAMSLSNQPKELVIVGAGAIGIEFAYFYQTIGTKVTVIEFAETILPNEDREAALELQKQLHKKGISIYTSSKVLSAVVKDNKVELLVNTPQEEKSIACECVLSAIGISANIDNIGLKMCGIETENGKIKTNSFYQTTVESIYAIGDIINTPALAHVASMEGVIVAEHLSHQKTNPINYTTIPSCVYCSPELASVGFTEQQLKDKNIDYRVGKFPLSASGKAKAIGKTEGFVKVLIDKKYDEILGIHAIGEHVTEITEPITIARNNELTGKSIINTIFPHPTLSEAIKEAIEIAHNQSTNF